MNPGLKSVALLFLVGAFCWGQGSVLLVGGGGENYNDWSDAPYRWLVTHAPNRKVLVLHYSDTSTFFSGYFPWLSSCTVRNRAITSTTQANDSATYRFILEYDGIFLRGGDQWQYVSRWKGTLTEQAIREVYQRGGVIGGTSAGAHVLSQLVFDARTTSVSPRTALRNPLGSGITFTTDFLGFAPGILADSHFYERGRIGRLLAMLAFYKNQTGNEVAGAGIDYNTALAVSPDGTADVMGAGTVTILRLLPSSSYVLETAKPLSLLNVRLDQLTSGWKISLTTWEIEKPGSAVPFSPVAVQMPSGRVILDGGGQSSEWLSATGSVERLISLVASSDTIGVIASPSFSAVAETVRLHIVGKGMQARTVLVQETNKNDAATAASISGSAGFVVAGVAEDSIGSVMSGTAVGNALRQKIGEGAAVDFLGNAGHFSSGGGVGKTEYHTYAAYYGYMTLRQGMEVSSSLAVMTRLYENSSYIDNRASGLFWGLGKFSMGYGILLDNGSYAEISGGLVRVAGSTPAMIVDARNVAWVDFPTFRDPGKANPRQNAALLDARIHVVRDGELFSLQEGRIVGIPSGDRPIPSSFLLHQNYPNPFNSSTTFSVELPVASRAAIRVFNLLGKEVGLVRLGEREAGHHSVTWTSSLPSGVYFYRLEAAAREGALLWISDTRRMLVLR
jgi:cyanophycinase